MAWLYIILADVFEIAWPFALKWSLTYSKWAPALGAVIIALPVFFLIGEAVKHLPAATVYASFVGIGTVGTSVIGIIFFGESANPGRVCSFVLIILGTIGLRLFAD
jgi:quaternary ammonium compound-resistance protein SugE